VLREEYKLNAKVKLLINRVITHVKSFYEKLGMIYNLEHTMPYLKYMM